MVVSKKTIQETLFMKTIAQIIGGAQALLPVSFELKECFEEHLTAEYKTFLHILRVVEEYTTELSSPRRRMGRPSYPLISFFRSELAKRYFDIEKTSGLITRVKSDPNLRVLCGFEKVPDTSQFSRCFARIAEMKIMDKAQDALVRLAYPQGAFVQHVCRDSTAIPAREKAPRKNKEKAVKPAKKRGRQSKNTITEPKQPTVLETHITQEAAQSIDALDKKCSWGVQKNSQGHIDVWKGYKPHLDVPDAGFPLTACVTSAHVHDSQLAIPMEKLTEQKVQFGYSIIDAGYDAKAIRDVIASRERVPIIEPNNRGNENRPPLDPAKQERYQIRTTVERSNSHLKDSFIPRDIYVKGIIKVSCVLMSAVVCLAALKYLHCFLC
jgi:IS5 family transposase